MNPINKVLLCLLLQTICFNVSYSRDNSGSLKNFQQTGVHRLYHSMLVNPVGKSTNQKSKDEGLNFDKCIILAEQSQNRIAIVNVESGKIVWQWKAEDSNVNPDHWKWFGAPSDAKVVYNGRYILLSASLGGIALVRIKDKKTVFYAYAGGNTHSIELLPDGNIVSASSTGNYLTVFKTDTINKPEAVYAKKVNVRFGHNIVWDKTRQVLWTAAMDHLVAYKYNFNCTSPDLTPVDSVLIPGDVSHDLFPVNNEDALWLTTNGNSFKVNLKSKEFQKLSFPESGSIKSLSTGPKGQPIIIVRPKVSWWTDEIFDLNNKSIFKQEGFKIYKARWFMENTFSYPKNSSMHLCK